MVGRKEEENPIWAALTEPFNALIEVDDYYNKMADDIRKKNEAKLLQEDGGRRRYRKRIHLLQTEVEEVNEEATKTRKLLWEAQDQMKETDEQIRKLENHLNEILELREKDLATIKMLRVENSDCVENESRARDAMEVFKKCYKRSQIQIKQQEEEIAVLREQVQSAKRGRGILNTSSMVDESALEYIQTVSNDKEKRLKQMLSETESQVDLWRSKYKVAQKRCLNWQEQIFAMENPSEGAEHIKRQTKQIEKLEGQLKVHEKEQEEREERESQNILTKLTSHSFCSNDRDSSDDREGITKTIMDGLQNLNCAVPTGDFSSSDFISAQKLYAMQ